jgi:hypothetical protein
MPAEIVDDDLLEGDVYPDGKFFKKIFLSIDFSIYVRCIRTRSGRLALC